jgi:hypothetical protein
MTKGCYGYLKRQKKMEILKTILYFGLSGAVFAAGYFTTGTKTNLLTIVAVLGCLPASKSMVSMIMYLRAGVCSKQCYEAVRELAAEDMTVLYDLYLTAYKENFQLSAAVVRSGNLCGFTEDSACDLSAGEKHMGEILRQSGYNNLTVKLFDKLPGFTDRMKQLAEIPEKDEKKDEAIAEILRDISL